MTRAKPRKRTRVPPGAVWRILAHAADDSRSLRLYSSDYPEHVMRDGPGKPWRRNGPQIPKDERVPYRTVFDEVVISGGRRGDCIHLEQMDRNTWYLGIGEQKVMLTFTRSGRLRVGEFYT